MSKKSSFLIIVSILLFFIRCTEKQQESQQAIAIKSDFLNNQEIKEQWGANKISLFVHFGVYSSLGGEWNNQKTNGAAENILANMPIATDEYQQIARDFSPKKWDADEIVTLAEEIEAGSIIFTAKHNDGFCLFKTSTTPFNIADFSNINRDILAELSDACQKANIKLGINFSLTDWNLPEAWPVTSHNGGPVTNAHFQINLQQIKELLTNYGPISTIYFHSGLHTPEQSKELRQLIKSLQPQCLISDGIGNDMGDFIASPFNQPLSKLPETPWVYRSSFFPPSLGYDKNKKSVDPLFLAQQKIRELVKVISDGGNYALNLAPRGNGSPDPVEVEILQHMGRWIKVNYPAISNTDGNAATVQSPPFWMATSNENLLYLFVDSVPSTQKLNLPNLNQTIAKVRFLGSGIEPQFYRNLPGNEIIWTSPAMADPMQLPVLEITLEETLRLIPEKKITIEPNDTIILNADNALTYGSFTGSDALLSIPSTTRMRWNIESKELFTTQLRFTEHEVGHSLKIKTDTYESDKTLKGKPAEPIHKASDSIKIIQTYRSSSFYGPFNEVHINPKGNNRIQVSSGSWMVWPPKKDNTITLPLTNYYYYVEINSDIAQQYCFEIRGNNGIQLWVNGQERYRKINYAPDQPLGCKIVLDLKKGINILLIRNFNRWGGKDHFELTPLPDARWHVQSVNIPGRQNYLEITEASPANPHADIDLPNFSIEILPKN